jgi:hypothetical protein
VGDAWIGGDDGVGGGEGVDVGVQTERMKQQCRTIASVSSRPETRACAGVRAASALMTEP